ncbi:class I SAM-dependent methyltransferase [Haloimpatiens sp. FM7315]|uniref:class I SAM-dependent methyltransferase n=1 Tax=Haloimpatiens sp. FM7315 TaxID=3298609 RepID=UPI00370B7323
MLDYKKMRESEYVEKQYENILSLNERQNFHEKYSINKEGFKSWLYKQYEFTKMCSILELGSGKGDLWKNHISDIVPEFKLVLSDFSDGMVEYLRNEYDKFPVDIKKIDIQDIPYDNDTFDIIIANSMLYHIPNIDKALCEVYRVLKKGGKFYTATFGENGLTKFIFDTLKELQLVNENKTNVSFTLQNGYEQLRMHFANVQCREYYDRMEISESKDLVEYIYSMTSMEGLSESQKTTMIDFYEKKKNAAGIIEIPKEYGMFIGVK